MNRKATPRHHAKQRAPARARCTMNGGSNPAAWLRAWGGTKGARPLPGYDGSSYTTTAERDGHDQGRRNCGHQGLLRTIESRPVSHECSAVFAFCSHSRRVPRPSAGTAGKELCSASRIRRRITRPTGTKSAPANPPSGRAGVSRAGAAFVRAPLAGPLSANISRNSYSAIGSSSTPHSPTTRKPFELGMGNLLGVGGAMEKTAPGFKVGPIHIGSEILQPYNTP